MLEIRDSEKENYKEESYEETLADVAYNFEMYPEGNICIFEDNPQYIIDPEEQMEKLNDPEAS